MASVSPMSISAARTTRRLMSAAANVDPALAALGQSIKPATINQIEPAQNQQAVVFYPGFGAQPPMVVRPLMMIDPSSYYHMRRWVMRIAP